MAGDWIKMRGDLINHPAVALIAKRCEVSTNEVLGALFRLWYWADSQTEDGVIRWVDDEWVDRLVSVRGLSGSCREVGWLASGQDGIVLPNFDHHMGRSARARALDADRKRASRAKDGTFGVRKKSAKRPGANRTKAGLEKRREEKKLTPPTEVYVQSPPSRTPAKGRKLLEEARSWEMPAVLGEGFRVSWGSWVEHMAGQARGPTESQLRSHLAKLASKAGGPEGARLAVEYCIGAGASGFSEKVLEISAEKAGQTSNGTGSPLSEAERRLLWGDDSWRTQR